MALLSPNTLAEIVERFSVRPTPDAAPYLRFPLRNCMARAATDERGQEPTEFDIVITDLALGGFGFTTRARLSPGMTFRVELAVPGVPTQLWCCRVIDIHEFGVSTYRAGAKFERLESA